VTAIPRSLVADALGVDAATLPEGDLPVARLAERYRAFLAAPEDDSLSGPDAWTFAVIDALVQDHPDLACDALLATLPLCATPDEVSLLAAGPVEDLLALHGAQVIGRIETAARSSARMRFLLSGVWQRDMPALLWARVTAARAPGPDIDAGDPLPANDLPFHDKSD
jgi:hypothetical protein